MLDRWSILEPKMATCITFSKGSDVEFDSEINKTQEYRSLPKDGIMCTSLQMYKCTSHMCASGHVTCVQVYKCTNYKLQSAQVTSIGECTVQTISKS